MRAGKLLTQTLKINMAYMSRANYPTDFYLERVDRRKKAEENLVEAIWLLILVSGFVLAFII